MSDDEIEPAAAMNVPDMLELIKMYGGYDKIPDQAWVAYNKQWPGIEPHHPCPICAPFFAGTGKLVGF